MEALTDPIRMKRPLTRSQLDRQRKKLRAWRRGYQLGVLCMPAPPPLTGEQGSREILPPPGLDIGRDGAYSVSVADTVADTDIEELRHDWTEELVHDTDAQFADAG